MPRDIDNDLKKFKDEFVSNFSKIITSESKSDGEVSVYEIDIVGYDNPKGESNDLKVTRVQKKKKRKIESNEFLIDDEQEMQRNNDITSNSLSKTDYSILEALTRPNLNSVAYEIHIDKQPNLNGSQRCTWKIKSESKSSSLEGEESDEPPTDSDDKFKTQMRKRIIEDFLTKNNVKFKNAIQNLKKLDNGSVHLHHHEHHHHYYLNPAKALEIKNLLKKMQSSKTVDNEPEPKQKKKKDSDKKDLFSVTVPDTGSYICQNATNLMEQKVGSKEMENFTAPPERQRNSSVLQGSSSIDSFLGMKSEVMPNQTFSQSGFNRRLSKSASNETISTKDACKKSYLDTETKDLGEPRAQKVLKSDYTEIMQSLKVLDKYLEPKMITSTKTKISYLKCTCPSEENEEKMEDAENQTTGEELVSDDNGNITDESTMKTGSNSDQNRCALSSCAKKNHKPFELKNIPQHIWTKHMKQELKHIKNRLHDLEKLYSKKKKESLAISTSGNRLERDELSGKEISVFSTKTFIMKSDPKLPSNATIRGSNPNWIRI